MRRRGAYARGIAALLVSAAALAGSGLVAGCSDSAGGKSSSGSYAGANGAAAGPAAGGALAPGAGQKQAGTTATSATVAATADLIIMAGLQLAVPNPTQAAALAEQDVLAAGGYVAAEAEGVGPQILPAANRTADGAEGGVSGVSPMTLPPVDAAPNSEQALLYCACRRSRSPKCSANCRAPAGSATAPSPRPT